MRAGEIENERPGSGRGTAEGGGLDSGGAKEDNERVKRGGEDEDEEGGALENRGNSSLSLTAQRQIPLLEQ